MNMMIIFFIYATIYYFAAVFVKNYNLSYTNLMISQYCIMFGAWGVGFAT